MRNVGGEISFGASFTLACGHHDSVSNAGPLHMAVAYKTATERDCPTCTNDASKRATERCGYRARKTVRCAVTAVELNPTE